VSLSESGGCSVGLTGINTKHQLLSRRGRRQDFMINRVAQTSHYTTGMVL
jgi:hypothetical protein